jgi:hypothetical protein
MGVLDQFGGAVGSVLGQGKNAGVSAVLLPQQNLPISADQITKVLG